VDNITTINSLRALVQQFVDDRNWQQYHNAKDISLSISIEAAELLEIFQWQSNILNVSRLKLANIKDELADVLIYCLSLANSLDIDISEAIIHKMEKNERKYPCSS